MSELEIPERLNLAAYLLEGGLAAGHGPRRALVTDAATLTYAELHAEVQRWAAALLAAGVRPEERIIVALPDGLTFPAALLGALWIGAVGVMLNPDLDADSIGYFLELTRASACVVPAGAPAFLAAAGQARFLRTLIESGAPAPERALGQARAVSAEALLPAASVALEPFPSHRDDAALWLFSGGTTGRPKAVVQPHGSFVNTTVLYGQRTLGMHAGDVVLSVPKLYFGYATGLNLLFPLSVGAAAVLFPERCTPATLFEKIRHHRPTVLVNVPTMIGHLVAHPDAAAQDLSSLRLSTSAGEALPIELHERWRRAFGVEILDGLGTAEMWHIFLSNRPGAVRPGTLGQAVVGFELKVTDDDGRELGPGEVGWLQVKGRSRALGYWQALDKTAAAFRGEWYVTGDMVARDADGWFTYHGRGDDMLKVSGKWLAPAEVENCLLTHPSVAAAAVVGITDANGLTRTRAHVVLGTGADPDPARIEATLIAHVKAHLDGYKAPREVRVHAELPRTHLGKVDRGALRRG